MVVIRTPWLGKGGAGHVYQLTLNMAMWPITILWNRIIGDFSFLYRDFNISDF
jgi:hypothetical protein